MSWNYRVVKKQYTNIFGEIETEYSIREVFYDKVGNANGWADPIIIGSSLEEIQNVMISMIECFNKQTLNELEGSNYLIEDKVFNIT